MVSDTLAQQAYRRIYREILSGTLSAGSRVSEMDLSQRLNIGRMPIREAIRQFQSEGLMEQIPRRGTFVRRFSLEEILELYEFREAVEPFAVAKAVVRIDAQCIVMLESLCEQMHGLAQALKRSGFRCLEGEVRQRHLSADMAFHILLIRAAGNRSITQSVARTRVIVRIFSTQTMAFDLPFLAQAYRFHRRILRAVKRRDPDAAREWTLRHIRRGMEQLSDLCAATEAAPERQDCVADLPEQVLREIKQWQHDFEAGQKSR